jgi:hypothetical protein
LDMQQQRYRSKEYRQTADMLPYCILPMHTLCEQHISQIYKQELIYMLCKIDGL